MLAFLLVFFRKRFETSQSTYKTQSNHPDFEGQHATPLAGAAGLPGSLGSRRLYSIVPWGDMLYLA